MGEAERMEFESLLSEISFGVGMGELAQDLYAFSFRNVPRYLYRYRDCKGAHSFNDIENGAMTFSSPSTFRDREDAAIRNMGIVDQVAALIVEDEAYVSAFLTGILECWRDCADATVAAYLKDAWDRFCRMDESSRCQIIRKALLALEELLVAFEPTNAFRSAYRVACLCENEDSPYMWEAYAGGGTGYLIEYDTVRLFEIGSDCKQTHLILPIVYTDRLPDTLLLAFLPFFRDPLERLCGRDVFEGALAINMVKALFFKLRKAFELEEEWRMSISITEEEIEQLFVTRKVAPSCLVAGPNMIDGDKVRLYRCAKEKGIFIREWN